MARYPQEYEELSRKGGQAPDICDISEEQYQVIARDWWTFFPFFIYGIPIQHNIEQCPETARLLELIPDKTTVFFPSCAPAHTSNHIAVHIRVICVITLA